MRRKVKLYLVKKYKLFGKYDVEHWISDSVLLIGRKVIVTNKSIISTDLPYTYVARMLEKIRKGEIRALKTIEVDI